MLRKMRLMDDADRQMVSDAVALAEQHTSGEIVTIASEVSDHYGDIANIWATIAAFLSLAAMAMFPQFYLNIINRMLGGWSINFSIGEILAFVFFIMAIKWAAMRLIMNYIPLRIALASKGIKQARVRARAIDLFKVGAQARTRGKTGILIYLSMHERRAEIVADEAISSQIAPEIWGDAMIALVSNLRAGKPGEGMAEAVRQVGVVLAQYLPQGEDNPNELPDRLIEL